MSASRSRHPAGFSEPDGEGIDHCPNVLAAKRSTDFLDRPIDHANEGRDTVVGLIQLELWNSTNCCVFVALS